MKVAQTRTGRPVLKSRLMPTTHRLRTWFPVTFLVGTLLIALLGLLALGQVRPVVPGTSGRSTPTTGSWATEPDWPAEGEAALIDPDSGGVSESGRQRPVPIASVTKVMTALVVLDHQPIRHGENGFSVTISQADVRDTEERTARSESVIPVRAGEVLSERQALLGLMLPSANNVAHILAEEVAGSEKAFVAMMNGRARQLHLDDTRYADASGFDPGSRSTAHDQALLAATALRSPTFAWLVRQPRAELLDSSVENTDRLLGEGGWVGVKTGSTTPAGGCFVFAARRQVHGKLQLVVGAVTGQRGSDLVEEALHAAEELVDSVTDVGTVPGSGG